MPCSRPRARSRRCSGDRRAGCGYVQRPPRDGPGTGADEAPHRGAGATAVLTSEAGSKGLIIKARGGDYPDLFVSTGGNVGIGTTALSQKLDVAGYINGQSGLCIGGVCRTTFQTQACPAGQAITAINQNGSVVCQSFAAPSPPPAPTNKCVPGAGTQSCDTVCANYNCSGCSSECPACNVTPCRGCSNPSGGWWCLCTTCY